MASSTSGLVACPRHPATQTPLRCSRCGTPICPRCLVMTPVGARCPACGAPPRARQGEAALGYLRGVGAGLGVAALGGFVAPLIPFLGLFALLFAGWAAGEAVSRAARRSLPNLGAVAAVVTIVGIALGLFLLAQSRLPPGLPLDLRLQVGLAEVAARLFSMFGLFVLLAALVASSRLR